MVGQNKKKSFLVACLYLAPALVIIGAFTIYPLFKSFIMSFYEDFNVFTQTGEGFGFSSYSYVLHDALFWKSLKNTAVYAFWTVPFTMVLSLVIAMLLNSGIKFSKFFRTAYFLPYVTNVIAIGLAFQFIFHSRYGIVNHILGVFGIDPIMWLNNPKTAMVTLVLFGIWNGLAFKIVIFMAGLQGIDEQLYQAARIDEASKWSQFIHITVPQLAPIIAYQMIISVIGSFKVYNEVIGLFGSAGPNDCASTLVYYIFDLFYNYKYYNHAAAASVLMLFIIIAFTFVQLKISNKTND